MVPSSRVFTVEIKLGAPETSWMTFAAADSKVNGNTVSLPLSLKYYDRDHLNSKGFFHRYRGTCLSGA